MAKGTKSIL